MRRRAHLTIVSRTRPAVFCSSVVRAANSSLASVPPLRPRQGARRRPYLAGECEKLSVSVNPLRQASRRIPAVGSSTSSGSRPVCTARQFARAMALQTPSHGSRRRTRQTPRVSCQGGISSTPACAGVACRGLGGRRHFPGRHCLLRRCLGEEGVK